MTEKKSCLNCKHVKKIYAYENGRNLGLATIECTKYNIFPMVWGCHECSGFESQKDKE